MPTQEERLAALEQKTTEGIRDQQANMTILLGVAQSQGQDIKRTLQRLDSVDGRLSVMDGRLNIVDGRLNFLDGRLATVEQDISQIKTILNEHTVFFAEHKTLLAEIIARLPEKQ